MGVGNTLPLENGFNDLRDNEGRGARHKARSEVVIQALSLSSMKSRYEETAPLLKLNAEDVAGTTKAHVRGDLFLGAKAPTTKEALGVDPTPLVSDRGSWPSTSPHELSSTQLALLHAAMLCEEDKWQDLWVAQWIPTTHGHLASGPTLSLVHSWCSCTFPGIDGANTERRRCQSLADTPPTRSHSTLCASDEHP